MTSVPQGGDAELRRRLMAELEGVFVGHVQPLGNEGSVHHTFVVDNIALKPHPVEVGNAGIRRQPEQLRLHLRDYVLPNIIYGNPAALGKDIGGSIGALKLDRVPVATKALSVQRTNTDTSALTAALVVSETEIIEAEAVPSLLQYVSLASSTNLTSITISHCGLQADVAIILGHLPSCIKVLDARHNELWYGQPLSDMRRRRRCLPVLRLVDLFRSSAAAASIQVLYLEHNNIEACLDLSGLPPNLRNFYAEFNRLHTVVDETTNSVGERTERDSRPLIPCLRLDKLPKNISNVFLHCNCFHGRLCLGDLYDPVLESTQLRGGSEDRTSPSSSSSVPALRYTKLRRLLLHGNRFTEIIGPLTRRASKENQTLQLKFRNDEPVTAKERGPIATTQETSGKAAESEASGGVGVVAERLGQRKRRRNE